MENTDTSELLHSRPLESAQVPLHRQYPMLYRKIIKKCFWRVLVVFIMWGVGAFILLQYLPVDSYVAPTSTLAGGWSWASWVIMLPFALLVVSIYEILYFFTYFYDVDDQNIVIRKGVLVHLEITVPYTKIFDVYVEQDMLDMLFGLYDVHLSTPTVESGKVAHIDGVGKHSAAELRKLMLEEINHGKQALDLPETKNTVQKS